MAAYEIAIYYGAPTYQDEPEGRARKKELEEEFGLPVEEASVGTGADGPGLVVFIDIAPLLIQYGLSAYGVLSLGKDVTELVTFYVELAKKLTKYVKGHYAYLEHDAASALAVNAIVEHLGKVPKSIVLEGYMTGDPTGGGGDHMDELSYIGDPPSHTGAFLPHHFQFKIDGEKSIKAVVDSDGVKVYELPPGKAT